MYFRSALLIMLVLLIGYLLSLGDPSSFDLGQRIGFSLAGASVTFFCLLYLTPKHKVYSKLSRSLHFAWVCLFWVLVTTYQAGEERAELRQLNEEVGAIFHSVAEGKDHEINSDRFSNDDTLALTILKWNAEFYKQTGEVWEKAVDEAEYSDLLLLEHLVDPEFIADALNRLDKLEEQLDDITSKHSAHVEKLRLAIQPSAWETEKGRSYLAKGLEDGLEIVFPLIEEVLSVRKQEIREVREVMLTLAGAQDWYWLEDEMLVFADEDYCDAFNEHFNNIVRLEEQEEALLLKLQRGRGPESPLS